MTARDIHDYNGAMLAYIGDAVIELLIREALTLTGLSNTGKLSAAAQKLVCAKAQSEIAERLQEMLTPEEEAAYRLGRNHHTSGKPKSATAAEYSRATGLEAIFGYLHMTGNKDRIRTLFAAAYEPLLKKLEVLEGNNWIP